MEQNWRMTAEIVGPDILIVLVVLLIPTLGIWVAVDAGTKPQWAFERSAQNKTLWIVLPLVGIFLCGVVTVVAAIIWFASIRPKVVAASSGELPSVSPPQWARDPYGRHELRYFDGARWTAQVSDNGVTTIDNVDAPR
jgi:hypothetical protein